MKGKSITVDRPGRGLWLIPIGSVLFAVGATLFAAFSLLKFKNTTIQVSEKKKLDALRVRVKELESVEESYKDLQTRIATMAEMSEAIAKGEQQLTQDQAFLAKISETENELRKKLRSSRGGAKKAIESEIAKNSQLRGSVVQRKSTLEKALVIARQKLSETFRGIASQPAKSTAPAAAERAPAIPEGEVPAPDSGGAEAGE